MFPELALPTHRSRRRLFQRATGLPRNLTFTHAAKKAKAIGSEVRAQALFRYRFVGVVRAGHPLSEGDITRVWMAIPHTAGCGVRLGRLRRAASGEIAHDSRRLRRAI